MARKMALSTGGGEKKMGQARRHGLLQAVKTQSRQRTSGAGHLWSALNTDDNIISHAAYHVAAKELSQRLWDNRATVKGLVRHHLGLGDSDASVFVAPPGQWIRDSFNVCIPVAIRPGLMVRCAMAHKLAEARYPGTIDEKLGCEVGTYAWMQAQCPEVRIPHLYGFGLSDHSHFTHQGRLPFYRRLCRAVRRRFGVFLGWPALSCYAPHPAAALCLPTAYMLLKHIGPETGCMLSNTWVMYRGEAARRRTLFRGMARIMLSLARIPQPRMGSFRFCPDDGTMTLTNRPLPCALVILENDGAPRTLPADRTYTCVEPFVADMLALQDSSFLANPNAIYDASDCRALMAARTVLRALLHRFTSPERRTGPFHLQLTDFHTSNIFVDDDWNVTCLLDLELVSTLPAEMLAVPYWLTRRAINQLADEHLAEFDKVRQEFMDVLEKEEATIGAIVTLVDGHVSPRYCRLSMTEEEVLSQSWCQGAKEVMTRKVAEHERYAADLGVLFGKISPVDGVEVS
ncbi:hypothetical protein C8A05DRAFT_45791 [Staphylotrichum tortipilum]|uniref:Aminoglycoside phosphotransferase domain-containing protein n=1 Tax=Staphylotrichum tortipilum TaxID=2831512 RepID=A0AAN6MHL1_9PEZI|nr:hypothetical protein C8A05DRAFT_45791 [Staphylotrichum longicolle]